MTAPLPAYFYAGDTLCADCAADVRESGGQGAAVQLHRRDHIVPGLYECAYCHDVIGSALARVAESESGGTTGGGA